MLRWLVSACAIVALGHLPPGVPARVEGSLRRAVLRAVFFFVLGLPSCAHTPTVVDAGAYGGGWVVMEWRGVLVELRTEARCESKRSCSVVACVTVAGGEPVCREV